MRTDKHLLTTLFLSTFSLSAFTFGGGFVIIPLMRKKFVDQLHWIEEQEMLDLTAIAQSSPGAIAVNASILVGYHIAGIIGALVTVLGTVLPPLLILSVVSLFYEAFRDNAVVAVVMHGMQAGIAAVIFDVTFTMGHSVLAAKRALPIVMLVASFVAVRFLKLDVILIILACASVGILDTLAESRARRERG